MRFQALSRYLGTRNMFDSGYPRYWRLCSANISDAQGTLGHSTPPYPPLKQLALNSNVKPCTAAMSALGPFLGR